MAGIQLYDYQLDAVRRMKNGCILCGDVGSGKSRTALAYYYICQGGEVNTEKYELMNDLKAKDLYIITTARKRDTFEWEGELAPFLMSTDREVNLYSNRVTVDSWNNIGTGRLMRLRRAVLVEMDFKRNTVSHHEDIFVDYNKEAYKAITKDRWDIRNNKPLANASDFCQALRRAVNSDPSRCKAVVNLVEKHRKAIIFYNFDYELEILRGLFEGKTVAEWNGHKHQPVPEGDEWVYLVQYTAGAEGWNCVRTDTIIFYSQNYSYKVMAQSCGRIDRLNTPYTDLYYYHLRSRAGIDLAISKALAEKKKFNEAGFCKKGA